MLSRRRKSLQPRRAAPAVGCGRRWGHIREDIHTHSWPGFCCQAGLTCGRLWNGLVSRDTHRRGPELKRQMCDLPPAGGAGVCHCGDEAVGPCGLFRGKGRMIVREPEGDSPELPGRKRLREPGRKKGRNREVSSPGLNVCVPPPPEFLC